MDPPDMSNHLTLTFECHGAVSTLISLVSVLVLLVADEILLGLEIPSAVPLPAGFQNVVLPVTPHKGVINCHVSTDAAG